MDNKEDSGTYARLQGLSKDLAPIVAGLTSKGGCLVGQCEKAIRDIQKVINKRIMRNSIMWIILMFVQAILFLLLM